MGDYRTLLGYQKAFSLAMRIYHVSKTFPADERFGLKHTSEDGTKTTIFQN